MAYYKWMGDPDESRIWINNKIAQGKIVLKPVKSMAWGWRQQADGRINVTIRDRYSFLYADDATPSEKALGREIIDAITLDATWKLFRLSDEGYSKEGWFEEWGLDLEDLFVRLGKAYEDQFEPLDLVDVPAVTYYMDFSKEGYYVVKMIGDDPIKILGHFTSYSEAVNAASVATASKVGILACFDGDQVWMSWIARDPLVVKYYDAAMEAYETAQTSEEALGKPNRVWLRIGNEFDGIVGAWVQVDGKLYEADLGEYGIVGFDLRDWNTSDPAKMDLRYGDKMLKYVFDHNRDDVSMTAMWKAS